MTQSFCFSTMYYRNVCLQWLHSRTKKTKTNKNKLKTFSFYSYRTLGTMSYQNFCHFTHFSLDFLQFPPKESSWHTFITTASFLDHVEKPTCAAEIASFLYIKISQGLNLWLKFFTPFYSNCFYDVKWVWYTGWRSRGEPLNHQVGLELHKLVQLSSAVG